MNYDIIYGLGIIFYVIVTVILWRNITMPLFFKASFCFLAVPIFYFGIVANLWLFDVIYPEMFVIHANAQGGYRGGEKGLFATFYVTAYRTGYELWLVSVDAFIEYRESLI